jgi:DNA-binding response OmpR family regulator
MKQDDDDQAAILIVEDDRLTLEKVTDMLVPEGYRIRTASDGAQCLEMLKDFKPELILMDVGLPNDGYRAR